MKGFYYRFKALIGDKTLVFWSFLFPILLAIFFNFTLVDVHKGTEFDIINVGVNTDNVEVIELVNQLESLDLVNVVTLDTPIDEQLKNKDIVAVIEEKDGKVNLVVSETTLDTSILVMAIGEYNRHVAYIGEVAENPVNIHPFLEQLQTNNSSVAKEETMYTPVIVYFYTTLAMLCMYSGNWGQKSSEFLVPSQSGIGIRNTIAPTSKAKVIFQEVSVVYTIFILEFIFHTLFLKYILNVPLGDEPLLYIGTGLVGGLVSVTIGYVAGVTFKSKETGSQFVTYYGLLCSFLSGMMAVQVRQLVNNFIPWIKLVSPASLITDNLYYIALGQDTTKILINIGYMLLLSIVLWIFAYRKLKVLSYDRI